MVTIARHHPPTRSTRPGLATFEEIYRANIDAVIGYFARRCDEPQTVADLTAATFHAAAGSFRRFNDRRESSRDWVFGIAADIFAAPPHRRDGPHHQPLDDDELEELAQRIDAERTGAGE